MSDDLRSRFPDLTPVTHNPTLFTFNGLGTMLYGRRDYDAETVTYVKTRCVCLVYVPIFALDSWRVADSTGGGWRLLGRCGISTFARSWNMLVIAGVMIGALSIGWDTYTSSPVYQAGQRLAQGHKAEAKSDLLEAANDYRQVAEGQTIHAVPAAAALAALANGPLIQAPAGVQAQVIALLAVLPKHACTTGTTPAEVAALAERLSAAAATPRAAITLLDAAAPVLAKDQLAAKRRALLDAGNAKDPKDPWVAVELALIAEEAGDFDRCLVLLEPCADQLGDGEGARMLGGMYAKRGRLDDSHRLLRPYVMTRLKELQAASDAFEQVQQAAVTLAYEKLKHNEAGKEWYDRYDASNQAGKDQMVQEWVGQRLRANPAITAAGKRISAAAPVVSVALDLGIVTIQRAQGFTDPVQRKAELEEAERIFLAIRGVAGETDSYRLWLAQVDYWLGKPKEGHALLDELLAAKKRDTESLLSAANVLREVGDKAGARTLTEEAFTAAKTPAERQQAAGQRSLLFIDLDDQITWLERCDQASPTVVAQLHATRGAKAQREGRDAEAITELNLALNAWSAMPRNASTLNNGAIVALQLYGVSGDPEHLRVACTQLEEAHLLLPTHTILLSNLLSSRVSLAGADSVRDILDARALHRALDASEFGHCYSDSAGRAAIIARYRADSAHEHVVADAERLMLMSPREDSSYSTIANELELARDGQALAAFAERTAQADLDFTAEWAVMNEVLAGKRDASMTAESAASTKRLEHQIAELRTAAKPATLALALDLLVSERLGAAAFGRPVDIESCLALAEEAAQLHPCHATDELLSRMLIHRAASRVAQTDATLAKLMADQHRLLNQYQVFLWLASDGRWKTTLAADADLTRAAALTKAAMQATPEAATLWDWALLAAIGDPGEPAAAAQLRADPILPLEMTLDQRLSPTAASMAVRVALFQRMNGEPAKAAATLEAARKRGLPLAAEL